MSPINPDNFEIPDYNTIEIKSAQVKQPISVRYAWKNTTMPDIFNQIELPLTTFELE